MPFSIIVLLPGGRRQTVKVDHNTTILEVLENVCQKANLSSEDYDLKHHRKILLTSSTIRFSSLPQNAQVELVPAQTKRVESDVKFCLQLESGKRIQGEAHPKTTLWEFLEKFAPDAVENISNPVIVFMRREIIGKDALEKTTLRSIGLTGGSAMFRLIDSSAEALRVQANVSTPLMRPQPTEPLKTEVLLKNTEKPPETPVNDSPKNQEPEPDVLTKDRVNYEQKPESLESSEIPCTEEPNCNVKPEAMEVDNVEPVKVEEIQMKEDQQPDPIILEKVVLLGNRNAVVYNMHLIPPAVREDLPDDFYDLTVKEIQKLAAASSRALREIIDAPLLTSAQRKLDEDGLILQKLSSYKSSVVRVRFPDQTVLQGCFTPVETVGQVKEFVREYLADKTLDFNLYVTPPKQILKEDLRLVEANCVPNAVLYLGPVDETNKPENYLQAEVLDKFSSFTAASQTAFHVKEKTSLNKPEAISEESNPPSTQPMKVKEPKPSTSHSSTRSDNTSKVPKWFKPGK